jgi:hypothetical protein
MQGKVSRRTILHAGAAASLTALVARSFIGTAHAQQKVAKSTVQYQDAPKGGHQCSGCSNFVPPDGCKVVAGKISPHGWCTIWTPK